MSAPFSSSGNGRDGGCVAEPPSKLTNGSNDVVLFDVQAVLILGRSFLHAQHLAGVPRYP